MVDETPHGDPHGDPRGNRSEDRDPDAGRRQGDIYSARCPCRVLLDVVSSKWSVMVVEALAEGDCRFAQLHRKLEGISPKVLTTTLRRLQSAGMVDRTVYAEVPARVVYSLTETGESAVAPVHALRQWAQSHYDVALAYARSRDD